MDHLIEYIIEYMWADKKQFQEEWGSGNYKNISDCPTYPLILAYCDSIAALNRMYGGYSGITPENLLEE